MAYYKEELLFLYFLIVSIGNDDDKSSDIGSIWNSNNVYLYSEKEYENFINMMKKPLSIIIMLLVLAYTFYYIYWTVGIENYINTLTYATEDNRNKCQHSI